MRANFARHGRRLFVHRPRGPSCTVSSTPARRRPTSSPILYHGSRRTIFDMLFKKPPREVKAPEYEPGWMQIMIWRSRMLDKVRTQPRKELLDAWRKLMQSKIRDGVPLNSTQALQCRRLIQYLANPPKSDQQVKPVSSADLAMTRQVLLAIEPIERTENHMDLARALHDIWASGNYAGKPRPDEFQWTFLIKALAMYGHSQEALTMLLAKWDEPSYFQYIAQDDKLIEVVASGLVSEGRDKELLELIQYAEQHNVEYSAALQEIVVTHFAKANNIELTKQFFEKPIDQKLCKAEVYRTIALFARQNNLQTWAVPFLVGLGELQPRKKYWDVLLQGILLMGRSLSEVEVMMGHMVDFETAVMPDIGTINGLLTVAIDLQDVQLAQDVLGLTGKFNLSPDGETSMHLMRIKLESGQLAEAKHDYDQVKYIQPWANESSNHLYGEYRQLVNEYLVALTKEIPPNFKLISLLLESVEEELMRLEPQTIAKLCLRFLENDQHFDVMDLLSAHSFKYSEAEREIILNSFVQFSLDPETSTQRAWDSYQLLHQYFQDTSFQRRMDLIGGFLQRKRSDMACGVFRHMRQHHSKAYHPTMETYLRCFKGLAKYPDLESLESLHNMLKMDTSIQPTTKLYTALMFAFTSCGKPLVSLDCWNEIVTSKHGPSYPSLEAVFYTLEHKSGGHQKAREIWDRIEKMDLEVPPNVYNAYIGAIAGSGLDKEVRSAILNMMSLVGSEPDGMTLAIAYNALPGQELQKGFYEWAKVQYPALWEALLKIGRRKNEYMLCQFKIKRDFNA